MPVYLLPGEDDPATSTFPQQPFNRFSSFLSILSILSSLSVFLSIRLRLNIFIDHFFLLCGRCLFPLAERFDTFHAVTNPFAFQIDGKTYPFLFAFSPFSSELLCRQPTATKNHLLPHNSIMGTSGQNVASAAHFLGDHSALHTLQALLQWRHIAPTCPDHLGAVPCTAEDPFVFDECPSVLFAGNQKKFEKGLVTGASSFPCHPFPSPPLFS